MANQSSYSQLLVFLMLAGVVITGLSSCNKTNSKSNAPSDAEITPTGIKFKFYDHKDNGRKAKEGEFMTFHLVIKNNKDSVLRSTYEEITGAFMQFPLQKPQFKGSFEEMLLNLSEGDSVAFWINIDSIVSTTNAPRPDFIEEGSDVQYVVKVLKIQSQQEIEKELAENLKNQREEDARLIDQYLKKAENKDKKFTKTETGMYYTIAKNGGGRKPQEGDTVSVHYTGKLLDGKVFDSSEGKPPFEFPLGKGFVIKGWDEGIALLGEGDKATLVIPSELAYGSQARGEVIPANAILIFEVELVGIK